MSSHIFHGPLTVDLNIAVTDGRGMDAVITYSMPIGKYPTPAEIEQGIADALKQAPDGFRVMTKDEWWRMTSMERFGAIMAMPGGLEWNKP